MAKMLDFDAENGENATIIEGESEDVTGLQDNIDAQLSEVFEQFGGDENDATFKINIYRVQEGKGKLGYCFSCVPSELPILDKIQSDFGAGNYEMRLYENTDKTRLKKRTKFFIEMPMKKPVAINPMSEINTIVTAMAEQQRASMEQFKEMLLMQRPTHQAAPQTSLTEIITAMAGLQGMMPKPAETNNMDMFLKGIELMKDFSGDAGGGREKGLYDMLIEAAKTFGGPIVEMAKNAAPMLSTGIPALPPGVSVPPGTVLYPAPVQATEAVPPTASVQPTAPAQSIQPLAPETTGDNEMGLMLKMQINNFVSQALAGKDPALYADLILDNMSEIQINEFLGQPNLKEFLISVNPDVSKCWPWFEKLQSEVMSGLTNTEILEDTDNIVETETPGSLTDATESKPNGDTASDT